MPVARVVVITGGASGIGLAAARRFAATGDRVVILDRDAAAANVAAATLPGAMAIACDVADEARLIAAIAGVLAERGRVDVLVNNAGVIDAAARPALDMAMDDFRSIMAINLDGAFVAAREAGRAMLASGGGVIVNVASLAGVVAIPNRTAYSASKAALIGLTRTLATEWAGAGIRVNAVLPGYVATEIVEALRRGRKVDLTQIEARIPLGRLAEPDEIAAVIEHLASTDAAYTTGAAITADGGYQAFGGTGAASAGNGVRAVERDGARVVIVTGGASGIGAATAARFAAQGDRVCVIDRDERGAAVAVALGPTHAFFAADITDWAQVARAISAMEDRFGRIDVLVNNAGVADAFVPTVDQSLDRFRRVFDINLTGAMHMAQAVAPLMIRQGEGGAIVNLASIAGILGLPRRNAYCASKAGIMMLTRSLAAEWACHGIRVNAVAPGYIATPGVAELESQGLRDLTLIRQRTPMGRLGNPSEIAAVIGFLTSPGASYVTGSTYVADGGWSIFGDAGPAREPAS